MSMTPRQMSAAVRKYRQDLIDAAIERGAYKGMQRVYDLAVNKYILRGGGRRSKPYPSKLTSRSGDLVRGIKILAPKKGGGGAFGIQLGLVSLAKYGGIHERGGTIDHPGSIARPGGVLAWIDAGGKSVFATRTRPHTIRIPARPYMKPAMAEGRTFVEKAILAEMKASAKKIMGAG
jgi:hypothetical protein